MTGTSMSGESMTGKSIAALLRAPMRLPAGPPTRLAESPLWQHQRRFYGRPSDDLWGTGMVPHGITSNPRIANTFARLTLSFLRAAAPPSVPGDGPAPAVVDIPHIIELGGGTGRFGYLFVRQLRELAPGLRFTYVLTDFSADRVAAWADHPSYRPLVQDGFLDFAVLDGDRPDAPELLCSGRTLHPQSLHAPVIGIANYVFDTLRHDSFVVRGGELLESRVCLTDDDPAAADGVPTTGVEWSTAPCGPVDEDLAPILDHYRETLDDTAVLVPVGALRCMDFLADLTSGPSCVLAADKGHSTPAELCSHDAPSVVFHGSGFSLMVNFDLLARYTRQRGGRAILPREPARSLVVGTFVRGAIDDPAQFEACVQDELVDTGPDNYFTLRPLLSAGGRPSIDTILAGLRLSRFDPALLMELLHDLLELLPTVADSMRSEVERALLKVWDNYFPIGEPVDMALCFGLAFSAMERCARAAAFLELSVKEHPDSAPAAFSMAVAQRGQQELRSALEWVEKALEIEPGFSEARALRAVLNQEIGIGVMR